MIQYFKRLFDPFLLKKLIFKLFSTWSNTPPPTAPMKRNLITFLQFDKYYFIEMEPKIASQHTFENKYVFFSEIDFWYLIKRKLHYFL